MCCNGVLFADVELKKGDSNLALQQAGIQLRAKTRRLTFLDQPCSALGATGSCTAYTVRPQMCRSFECRLLERTIAGEISDLEALKLIKSVRKLVAEAESLLNQLGDNEIHRPLSRRYANQMLSPFDLAAGQKSIRLRERLMKVMDEVNSQLSRHFLS